MPNIFSQVQTARPRRSVFDLSYEKKMTGDMGLLYPIMCEECVPGDKWSIANRAVIRFQPLVAPMMHEVNIFVHYFFVPYRLMWDDWEKFITGGADGNDTAMHPTWNIATAEAPGSLWDYLGFPLVVPNGAMPSDFPRIAYNSIWNNYYRNQNLQTEVSLGNGTILRRCWEKDYFTSSLPWQQRGDSPALPYGGNAQAKWSDEIVAGSGAPLWGAGTGGKLVPANQPTKDFLENNTVDMANALFDISDLRLAVQIQRFLERNARAGARYVEFLKAHFKVSYNDARLQRPEYIGGTRTPVQVSEVLQTSATSDFAEMASPQGNLAGHGIGVSNGFAGKYFCEEFGLIMGILSIMPRTSYQDGINRQWLRRTRYDYYFPEFANLSEQAVTNAEVCATTTQVHNEDIFGYQGRYDEMRIKNSMTVAGMRNLFDYWHLGRKFDVMTPPELNEEFVQCVPDKRVFAVQDEDTMIISFGNILRAVRPLPNLAEPGFMDHN